MAFLFDWIISTSIKGSFLVGFILLVKLLWKNKLGARWHYCIWFLLVLKLLIPFAPQSTLSIFNLVKIPEQITKTMYVIELNEDTITNLTIQGETDNYTNLNELWYKSNITMIVFITIWGIGILVLLAYSIRMNVKLWLLIRKDKLCTETKKLAILEQCKKDMNIKRNIPLKQSHEVVSPSLFGLFQPCILLPYNLDKQIDSKELKYVLLHELAHLKRKDIAVYCITGLLQIIHWFNPIIWYGFNKMRQDCEIACDALVLSRIDQDEYTGYGETIVHLVANMKKPAQPLASMSISGRKYELIRRIKMITLFKKNTYKLSILSIIIALSIGGVFLTNSKKTNNISTNNPSSVKSELSNTENTINSAEEKKWLWPLPNFTNISSPYGYRIHPITKKKVMHPGIDIPGPKDTIITAVADGIVTYSGFYEERYGNTIIIDHGNKTVSMYAHCSKLLVEKGNKIKAGKEIAKVGNTGIATGPHLHFEIRKDDKAVNPLEYFVQPNK